MNGVSTNAPISSTHLFLHEVAREPTGTKVRFLCCVLDYELSKALLHVEHRYPQNAIHTLKAAVDISQVLNTIKSTDLRRGAWLNVIGYIHSSLSNKKKRKRGDGSASSPQPLLVVQAVLIWDAGAIKLADYEKALSRQQQAKKDAGGYLTGFSGS